MDDEDLREVEETRNVATSDNFAGFSTIDQDKVRAAGLADIFRPSGETIGSKLLKRMGWRDGQGIGPKVRRKANVGEEQSESKEIHLFAPENSAMVSFSRKIDYKGLGYDGQNHPERSNVKPKPLTGSGEASEDEGDSHPTADLLKVRMSAKLPGNRAFGIGVLNDTGSDDEDPYEVGPKISYSKVIGGEKKSKKKRETAQTNANPLVKTNPVFLSKKMLSTKTKGFRRSHDGRLPLDGFVLAEELDGFALVSLEDDSMKPPEVPKDWVSAKTPAQSMKSLNYVSTAAAAKASSLNAQGRAALLGERPLPGKSVFDFLSAAARNRLASTSGRTDLPPAGSQPPPPGYESNEEVKQQHLRDLIPQLDSQVALQALSRGISGWMPYAEDQSKRDRYRKFLEIRAGLLDQLPGQAENTTKDDWVNEMNEFARAAQVFKPVTGLMASRFTSSSAVPRSTQETDDRATGDTLLRKPASTPEDPGVAAAKLGMFGPLTRTVINFYPTRLVCKRFNVQPPENAVDPDNVTESVSSTGRRSRPSQFEAYQYEATTPGDPMLAVKSAAHGEDEDTSQVMPGGIANRPKGASINPEQNEALEKDRPGQDVFRAVFGNDDEDEDG